MIRRAFVRALSGAILTTLLGVKAWRLEANTPAVYLEARDQHWVEFLEAEIGRLERLRLAPPISLTLHYPPA